MRPGLGFVLLSLALANLGGACTCSRGSSDGDAGAGASSADVPATASADGGGLSAPIAAVRVEGDDVIVAALDVAARAVRVQRINPKDEVAADRLVFEDVKWSSESDLRVVAAERGAAVTWRGLRHGKLVRQMVVLGADLAPKGEPVDVAAASCATRDAIWFTDGKRVHGRPWAGNAVRTELPREKEAALVCSQHRAYALLDEDDGTSVMVLGSVGEAAADAGRGDARAPGTTPGAVSLFKEADFGEDEQTERADYTTGDDLGVVRVAASGALSLREVRGGAAQPLRKLKTTIAREDDVVAVDASPRQVVIIYTQDVGDACPGANETTIPKTRVKAVRIDRTSDAESVVELTSGECGKELGPFFTAPQGDDLSVAWVERVPVKGLPRAPISALAHRHVTPAGALPELVRSEQPADALVDATCSDKHCFAAALARKPGMDAMVPGFAKVLRY